MVIRHQYLLNDVSSALLRNVLSFYLCDIQFDYVQLEN